MRRRQTLLAGAFTGILLAYSCVSSVAYSQTPTIVRPVNSGPVVVQLDAIPTGTLVTMLLRDVMKVPYVIAPDVLADRRPTSVRLVIPRNDIPARVVTYLRKSGFTVELLGGSVYVGRSRSSSWGAAYSVAADQSGHSGVGGIPAGSPVDPNLGAGVSGRHTIAEPNVRHLLDGSSNGAISTDPQNRADQSPAKILAYVPAHRDPGYLAGVLTGVFPALTFGSRDEVRSDSSQSRILPEGGADTLVMAGSAGDLERARKLVELLDRPRPMVSVKAVVVQASNVQSRGSALTILARLGDGRLTSGWNPSDVAGSNFVRLAAGATSAILSAVREDSRFKVVATPNLAALSGGVATMNAGASVPTVGSVTVADGGTPVQSIVYRDSGITLSVRPIVRGNLVELTVKQERSTFTRTATGVENSPTLNKSAAEASVTLTSGESVVLAGLTEASDGNSREGLLGGLLGVRGREKSDSELLVILTAEIVPQPAAPPGQFFDVETEETDDQLAPA